MDCVPSSVSLKVRPVSLRLGGRVRAHVVLCLLANYVDWHMRRSLAPWLFDDEQQGIDTDASPVEPARRSKDARAKSGLQRTKGDWPVHSFRTLLADPATLTYDRVQPTADVISSPTPYQAEALRLLEVQARIVASREHLPI